MTAVAQPSGTVTLVFTDIEGSTRLLEQLGTERYREALAEHRRVVREACARHAGYEVDYEGDAFFYAFATAPAAVAAVSEAMAGLEGGPIHIRVGIHTGEPALDPPKYVGIDVHRAARIMSAAHGRQVLLTRATRELLDADLALLDLGEHRLKDMGQPEWVYQLGPEEFPPLRSLENTNLPAPLSPLVGRARELEQVLALVRGEARLVTLTGPGGTGKTRLALEAAGELVATFANGVFLVPLAPLSDPELLLSAIAQPLGVKEQPGEPLAATIAAHLEGKRLLLLLDNFEHLREAAVLVADLLARAHDLHVIATSRERLRVSGEREYAVPPLAREEAVSLFCARSQRAPDDTIAAICARLDDLPLAIELAAARSKVLSPAALLDRLELKLLTGGAHDQPQRQRTLTATIEWSYELLSADERALLGALSVFAGGFTLESAEAVCAADLDTLASLVDKSLVRAYEERFSMLETIREFAGSRLEESGEAERIRGSHAAHFLELAERADTGYFGREQGLWLDRLGAEQDNIRAALAWAAEQPTDTALRLCGLLGFFWFVRGQWREAQAWCDRAAARPRAAPLDVSARAMEVQGLFLALLGDPEVGIALTDRAVETWRALGDSRRLGQSLVIRQMVAPTVEETEAACREAIAVARSCGDEAVLGISLTNSADLALKRGEFDAARAFAQESAEVLARSGDDFNRSGALANGASAALMQGDVDAAASGYADALELAQRLQAVEVVAWAISGLAAVAVRRGDPDRAVQLTGAADALLTAHGIPELGDFEDKLRDETIASAAAALGDHRVAEQLEQGLALTADEAVELALAG